MDFNKRIHINVKDIVEKNGKTIHENNLEKKHSIPIDSLVEVYYLKWFDSHACQKVIARLWVIDHQRDCDGTPLYLLSSVKKEALDAIRHAFEHAEGVIITGGHGEESLTLVQKESEPSWMIDTL